jgi:hypothetical protein
VFAIKSSTNEGPADENAYIGMALAVVVIISAFFTYYQVSAAYSFFKFLTLAGFDLTSKQRLCQRLDFQHRAGI